MIGLVLFKTDSIEYKIRFIFSINHDPYLNYEQSYQLLRMSIVIESDLFKLQKILKSIFRDHQHQGRIEKDNLYQFCIKNKVLINLIKDNIESIQKVDKLIENDLEQTT